MSYKVRVIPEDPTHNGYILKPLVCRMLQECGRPKAQVEMLTNPKMQGYEHAKGLLLTQVLDTYAHYDLLLFLPDADGKDRAGEFAALEGAALEKGVTLLCCAAVQEVEVWLLAGHYDRLDRGWREVRADVSVKENIFDPFLAEHGDRRRPGAGRDLLMAQTLRNYAGLLKRCPELEHLQSRIRKLLESTPGS